VVVALHGNLFEYAADGSRHWQLTDSGRDMSPVVQAGGGMAAFIRLSRSAGTLNPNATLPHTVMLTSLPPVGGGVFAVLNTVAPARTSLARSAIAFGRCGCASEVYFWNGNRIEWRRMTGNATVNRPGLGPVNPGMNVPIAVGPGDRVVAAPIPPSGERVLPSTLRIAIQGRGTITVSFSQGSLGGSNGMPPGSYPNGTGLTVAPDGKHLLFATIHRGEGYGISGIWSVPLSGGLATRVLGTATGIQGRAPFGTAVTRATQFQVSPNGRYLATDPSNNLWIRDRTGQAHTIHLPAPQKSCALSQWTWLADSSGFAYVIECSTPAQGSLTLSTVSLGGTARHTLLRVTPMGDGRAIDLAPATRCVACGG
jgi:hypothetical protein